MDSKIRLARILLEASALDTQQRIVIYKEQRLQNNNVFTVNNNVSHE